MAMDNLRADLYVSIPNAKIYRPIGSVATCEARFHHRVCDEGAIAAGVATRVALDAVAGTNHVVPIR